MATKTEITKQIRRLERYGKLNEFEIDDYISALLKYGINELSSGITYLGNNYTGFGFPKLPEIYAAIIASKPNDRHIFDNTGDTEITGAFMGAFSIIMTLDNRATFAQMNKRLRDINNRYGDCEGEKKKACIAEFIALKNEVIKLPRSSRNTMSGIPKVIPGPGMKPRNEETHALREPEQVEAIAASDDLPF